MPKLHYALEPNAPKRLELAWDGHYRDFAVKLDDEVVGQVPGASALAAGHSLRLPDGSTLLLKTSGNAFINELRVTRDGKPLPGSAADPASRLRLCYQLLLAIGGLNLVLGLVAAVLNLRALQALGFGWGSLLLGALYVVLGLLVRQYSLVALFMALVLYLLQMLFELVLPFLGGGSPNGLWVLARVLILIGLLQGIPAIRRLRRAEAQPTAVAQPAR